MSNQKEQDICDRLCAPMKVEILQLRAQGDNANADSVTRVLDATRRIFFRAVNGLPPERHD